MEPACEGAPHGFGARSISGPERSRGHEDWDEPLFVDTILNGPPPPPRESEPPGDDGALDAYSATITSVVDRLAPSVVNLQVMRRVTGGRRIEGGGSGVVITPDGYMLTSAHVVYGTDEGIVSFTDGREFDFEIIGADPLSDLAVLRTRATDLVPAELGNAGAVGVGQLVVARQPARVRRVGDRGDRERAGAIVPARAGDHIRFIENLIQTDAALHPGNSGGALADGRAEVVGINTALVGANAGQGLGLAVPINDVTRRIIAALMRDGRVRRASSGSPGASSASPAPLSPDRSRPGHRGRARRARGAGGPGRSRVRRHHPRDKGEPVEGMDDVQRLMDVGAIGRKVPVHERVEDDQFCPDHPSN